MAGQVGVFPTDTIYGFTADARNHDAVERILTLKERRTPISCIPHSLEWARTLVALDHRRRFDDHIDNYFGRYTTLWPAAQGERAAHPLVHTEELVGLRFPAHWIREFAAKSGIPLTTTSVNRTGKEPMKSLETFDTSLEDGIDFLIYEGELENSASTIVRCDDDLFESKKR